jgi:predicted nucleic acid-binding protein
VATKRLVLDASVAVKWLLPPGDEQLIKEALNLLRSHDAGAVDFIVPDLFWTEFAHAAQSGVRRRRWSHSAAVDALRAMLGYELRTIPSRLYTERALIIALANNCSLYDSIYVALAEEADCEMITADEKLVNALGSRFPVRWLGGMRF